MTARSARSAALRGLAAVAALALSITLAACSSGFAGNEAGSMRDAAVAPADGSYEIAATDMASGDAASTQSALTATGRSVISQGSIAISVADAKASAESVTLIAKGLGGYVESQNVSGESASTQGASLTIRVPASQFDVAFTELQSLGSVLEESRSAQDVTAQHVDLQARVAALQASVDRLTELMAGAATTSELIEAESALAARQADLDGLQAQLASLEDQVGEATIWVSLTVRTALP
ncbi:MAG: DUF4349 domain-containing protein, partial [Microbacteriaceae bacterium]|nr:DUF4349 domain-containing protein [Microbacteriaceae bacterium]